MESFFYYITSFKRLNWQEYKTKKMKNNEQASELNDIKNDLAGRKKTRKGSE
jgi:hypothetical protein